MKNCVYILRSRQSGKFYIGSTANLQEHLKHHKRGFTHTTKRFGEFDLVFYQEFESLIKARKVESKIKSWKRKDFIEKIIKDGKINYFNKPR